MHARNAFILLMMFWFLFKACYFAFQVSPGVPPDEMFHLQVIDLYKESKFLFPFNQAFSTFPKPLAQYARFAGTTEWPYLFHFTFGKLLKVLAFNTFDFRTIIFVRLVNTFLVCIGMTFFYRLSEAVLPDNISKLLAFAVHTNLLMFTFVAGAVSYDNLVFLLATASLFYGTRFFQTPNWGDFLKLHLYCTIGCLTKLSVLPFYLILVILLAGMVFFTQHDDFSMPTFQSFFKYVSNYRLAAGMLLICLSMFVCLNLEFYGGNLIQYGTISPNCPQIFSYELCLKNSYFRRDDESITLYNNLTKHGSDKALINSLQIGFIRYSFHWIDKMVRATVGIRSHLPLDYPETYIFVVKVLLYFSCFMALCCLKHSRGNIVFLVLTVGGYCGFLMWYWNYRTICLGGRLCDEGINGRYSFPVLSAICLLFSYYVLSAFKDSRRITAGIVLLCMFLYSEFPSVYRHSVFLDLVMPQDEQFYRGLPYYPNPVYDINFQLIDCFEQSCNETLDSTKGTTRKQ